MAHFATRIAAAAFLGFAGIQGASAYETIDTALPYVAGGGENRTVAYIGMPRGVPVDGRVVVTGSGENISVRPIDPPTPAPQTYIAVIEGSGENQSVRHIPVPRG
ncbi:hypothetical protein GXW74_10170 [Roseomonas eburnea]|uniref:Uncharacterized protein n=1 Tax=Neoroseomonas eburnea TaxID=1346889 RepID=A0A9X9XAW7_9PROT|nr:hypothetical protein [Neoroseomonas eburnea]MBR0680853.1 hypothetical protein [Neoroseomonas eburnea]